eukprot:30953-Chlamydomonas_euryale.AAC.6
MTVSTCRCPAIDFPSPCPCYWDKGGRGPHSGWVMGVSPPPFLLPSFINSPSQSIPRPSLRH